MQGPVDSPLSRWIDELEERVFSERSFAEVRRGVQALSRRYVQGRASDGVLQRRALLDGAGKRAAFALFYAPLHFLIVRRIVTELGAGRLPAERLWDLGCGTGAAGAAWASTCAPRPRLVGVDSDRRVLRELQRTWDSFDLSGRVLCRSLSRPVTVRSGEGIVAAWVVNELPEAQRDRLLAWLVRRLDAGSPVLLVEPVAGGIARWWDEWRAVFVRRGGRADDWRFSVELPRTLQRLDRAAGLDHSVLTARSLFGGPRLEPE